MSKSLQYLHRSQIDTGKWDQCIDNASNGLIYAYSFYLDHMCAQWDALVLNDYEVVMPIPKRRKWGIQYAYQPAFIASLGVFGKNVTKEVFDQFIQAIPAKYKLTDIKVNYGNVFGVIQDSSKLHKNFVLPLNQPYDVLYNGYRENTKRNIRKAVQLNNRYANNIPVEEVVRLACKQWDNITDYTNADYANFTRLYYFLHRKQKAITCGVYSLAGELIASSVYFFSHNRAYYILVGNHPESKQQGASHFLIDRFIYDFAGKPLLLDFEGSDVPGLAFFYSGFGATFEVYRTLWINRLPWYVNW
ncbi:MAG TPA: GNAT family N-acetyltransferase, partial [Niastella sp.]